VLGSSVNLVVPSDCSASKISYYVCLDNTIAVIPCTLLIILVLNVDCVQYIEL
jgi:hypothetical protein